MQDATQAQHEIVPAYTEPTKKHKLTIKQKKLVKALAEGKTLREASKIAELNECYACDVLKQPKVQEAFKDKLEAVGLTDIALATQIRNLALDAKKTLFFQYQGVVNDKRDVEALDIQADMTKFAAKLKGHVIDKHQVEAPGIEDILREIMDRRSGGK